MPPSSAKQLAQYTPAKSGLHLPPSGSQARLSRGRESSGEVRVRSPAGRSAAAAARRGAMRRTRRCIFNETKRALFRSLFCCQSAFLGLVGGKTADLVAGFYALYVWSGC